MKKMFKKLWHSICSPFIALACMIDESTIANEDGSWDTYWQKKNKREEKKQR